MRVQVVPQEGKSCIERHGAEVEQLSIPLVTIPDHAELDALSFRLWDGHDFADGTVLTVPY